jgi:hypothetical protein
LWVVYWKLAQVQLWLIGVPALRANQEVVVPPLDDFTLQELELETLVTAITLGDRVFARGEPISH